MAAGAGWALLPFPSVPKLDLWRERPRLAGLATVCSFPGWLREIRARPHARCAAPGCGEEGPGQAGQSRRPLISFALGSGVSVYRWESWRCESPWSALVSCPFLLLSLSLSFFFFFPVGFGWALKCP